MQKKIKDIKVGDLVKSWDFDEEKIVPAEVLKLWKHKNDKKCYKLNNKLTITGSHQVYTKDGYKDTKDIKVGDKLLSSNGKYIKVKSFKLHELDVPYVHNLTVKVNNYFADGILVHNSGSTLGGLTSGKIGRWHGKDTKAQSAMDALTDSLTAYNDTTALMQEAYAEQTGEIGESLDLQRKALSLEMKTAGQAGGQEKSALETKIGQTGLAQVGGEARRALELKRESEGEAFEVKGDTLTMTSEHEKNALNRAIDKEESQMKQSLRSQITSSRGKVEALDNAWESNSSKNVFRHESADSMLSAWDKGEEGFEKYCVTPNTKVEMWV